MNSIIIFYSSLILLVAFVGAKSYEGQTGQAPFSPLNKILDPILVPSYAAITSIFKTYFSVKRIKMIARFILEIVTVIGRNIQADIRILYRILTHRVKGTGARRERMTASFFLKDIADYKSRLLQQKHQ